MAPYEEVFEAVRTGDHAKVTSLIDADESLLNVHDHNQSTPLTRAFAYGHLDIALALIKRGANPFAMNHSDKWGMRYIIEKGGLSDSQRQQFVEAVISCNGRGNESSSHSRQSEQSGTRGLVHYEEIFHAVWQRDAERVAASISNDPKRASIRLANPDGPNCFYNGQPYCGLTPLHDAVIAGDEPTVKVLLKAGAEVDAVPHAHKPTSRHTPMYFVPQGCEAIAELLIEHGANPKHTMQYLTEGSESMRKVVVAHGAGETPLLRALIMKDFERAAEIIQTDASVINDRLPNARYSTPLHMAVKADSTKLVELLLDSEMDIDTPSRDGYTALAVAPEMYCSLEMFQLLIERGADVRAGGDSPFRAAAWQHAYGHENYEAVIRLLAKHGSKPRGLIHCARAGNLNFARLLLELGADVNETDELGFYNMKLGKAGHTALDYSTGVVGDREHPELAELLRSHGGRLKAELDS